MSVLEEDREAVAFQLRLKGYGQTEITHALELSDAGGKIWASEFTDGLEEFDKLRIRYHAQPWYRNLHGNFLWALLDKSADQLREAASDFRWQTPLRYDPVPTIAWVQVPQLWVLGGEDMDAPSAETDRRLKTLIKLHRPITVALYPHAEHGMTEFDTAADGTRRSTRYSAGYFQMIADFAKTGRLDRAYGDSHITRPR